VLLALLADLVVERIIQASAADFAGVTGHDAAAMHEQMERTRASGYVLNEGMAVSRE
jgi:DNA-binding IclR family transcriptional regulator